MSQYFHIILALILASVLTACGGGGSSDSSDSNSTTGISQTELSSSTSTTASIDISPESGESPNRTSDNSEEQDNTETLPDTPEEQNNENNNPPTLAAAENPAIMLAPEVVSTETSTEAPTTTPTATPSPAPSTVNGNVSWNQPLIREDGSILNRGDIVSYEISYIDANGGIQLQTISGNESTWQTSFIYGSYTFAIAAIDQYGQKSQLSDLLACTMSMDSISCK